MARLLQRWRPTKAQEEIVNRARYASSAFVMAILFSVAAQAQVQRTFVSAVSGNDANPCSRPLPCRNFAAAITQTLSGGEVVVLDSGGYGVFVISQAVSIEAPAGVFAGVAVFFADGIAINAGETDIVILRGLTLNGLGGTNGIAYYTGKSLHVERCAVNRMATVGILDVDAGNLFVNDSTITACATGIRIGDGSSLVRGVIDRSHIAESSVNGVAAYQNSQSTIRNSVIAGRGIGVGLRVVSQVASSLQTQVNVENCLISHHLTGISSSATLGTALTRVSNSTISHNGTGVFSSDLSEINTRLNNTLQGNTSNGGFNSSFSDD
jgi:parallel beta helix pectate lyase-like protein